MQLHTALLTLIENPDFKRRHIEEYVLVYVFLILDVRYHFIECRHLNGFCQYGVSVLIIVFYPTDTTGDNKIHETHTPCCPQPTALCWSTGTYGVPYRSPHAA